MTKIIDYLDALAVTGKGVGICHSKDSVIKLKEKIKYVRKNSPFKDELLWMNHKEEELLGISLSAQKIDSYNTSEVTHFCKDFLTGNISKNEMVFGVDILEIREYITRSGASEGKKRADLIVKDSTGKIKVKVWSDVYVPNESILVKNNSIILTGKAGYDKYKDYLIASNIKQAK